MSLVHTPDVLFAEEPFNFDLKDNFTVDSMFTALVDVLLTSPEV